MQLQPPTATHIRIRSVLDAHKLFHAVYLQQLPMVVRRLDAEERKLIKSGDVHVWEERGPGTEATGLGIERWTDGRLWGPSRVRDCFLFYHEKEREPEDFHGGSKWARMLRRRSPRTEPHLYDGTNEEIDLLDESQHPNGRPSIGTFDASQYAYDGGKDRLVKQTYSVLVHIPGQTGPDAVRKWHMTAYFSSSQKAQNQLRTIDEIPTLSGLRVPDGMYEPARAGRGAGRVRSGSASSGRSVAIPPLPASMQMTALPHPLPVPSHGSPPGSHSSLGSARRPGNLRLRVPSPPAGVYHQAHSAAPDPRRSGSGYFNRYTPYSHHSTPSTPTTEYDGMVYGASGSRLPPLRISDSSSSTPIMSYSLLRGAETPYSSVPASNNSRSRSSSISSITTPQTATDPARPTTPSFPSKGLVPLDFLESVRINSAQPASWSNARRAVDEEVIRNLNFGKSVSDLLN